MDIGILNERIIFEKELRYGYGYGMYTDRERQTVRENGDEEVERL
jgi:hypothetical protein